MKTHFKSIDDTRFIRHITPTGFFFGAEHLFYKHYIPLGLKPRRGGMFVLEHLFYKHRIPLELKPRRGGMFVEIKSRKKIEPRRGDIF